VTARIRYTNASLSSAVDQTIADALTGRKGSGGLIALNARGEMKFAFNTDGMFRGFVRADGKPVVMMFGE